MKQATIYAFLPFTTGVVDNRGPPEVANIFLSDDSWNNLKSKISWDFPFQQ
jgi:hypothetical protein